MSVRKSVIRILATGIAGFALAGFAHAGKEMSHPPMLESQALERSLAFHADDFPPESWQKPRAVRVQLAGLNPEQREQMRQQMRQHWQQTPPDPRGSYQPRYRYTPSPGNLQPTYDDRRGQDWRQPYGDERRGNNRKRY